MPYPQELVVLMHAASVTDQQVVHVLARTDSDAVHQSCNTAVDNIEERGRRRSSKFSVQRVEVGREVLKIESGGIAPHARPFRQKIHRSTKPSARWRKCFSRSSRPTTLRPEISSNRSKTRRYHVRMTMIA